MYGENGDEDDGDEEQDVEMVEEQWKAPEPAIKKRALETEDGGEEKLSKKQRKKLKKQKAESEAAVAAETNADGAAKPEKGEKAKKEGESTKAETQTLAGSVKVRDHKVGTGRKAKKGDRVSMRYVGKLTNGTRFDSNTKGKPVSAISIASWCAYIHPCLL